MKKMGRTVRLLCSVLAAGLLVTAYAVPQASAAADSDDGTYTDSYTYNLSNPDELRFYRGTSLFSSTITSAVVYDPVVTTIIGYDYATSTASQTATIWGDGTSITSLPGWVTTSSYLYATTRLQYLESSPIVTGNSTWSITMPGIGSTSLIAPYLWVLNRSSSGLTFTYNIGTCYIRVSLLNSSGGVISTSDSLLLGSSSVSASFVVAEPVYGVRFEISRVFSGADNGLAFGYWFTSSTSVTYTDTDYTGYYEDVINGLDSIDQNITDSTNSIIDNLLSIPDMIINGILGLFVPSADDLSGIYDDFTALLEDKLGAIWQVGSIISSFFEGLSTDEEVNTITFPGISFPMNGEVITIAASQTVQIVPDEIYNSDWYDMVRLAVTAVLVFAWVMGMEKMLERMLSPDGRSEE